MDIPDAQNEVRFVYMGGFWGTNCLVRNLAGVRSARHLGHSKSVYPCRRHRGIFQSFRSRKCRCVCRAAARPSAERIRSIAWGYRWRSCCRFRCRPLQLELVFPALMVLFGTHYCRLLLSRDAHAPSSREFSSLKSRDSCTGF
jgi:hypothetical protein